MYERNLNENLSVHALPALVALARLQDLESQSEEAVDMRERVCRNAILLANVLIEFYDAQAYYGIFGAQRNISLESREYRFTAADQLHHGELTVHIGDRVILLSRSDMNTFQSEELDTYIAFLGDLENLQALLMTR